MRRSPSLQAEHVLAVGAAPRTARSISSDSERRGALGALRCDSVAQKPASAAASTAGSPSDRRRRARSSSPRATAAFAALARARARAAPGRRWTGPRAARRARRRAPARPAGWRARAGRRADRRPAGAPRRRPPQPACAARQRERALVHARDRRRPQQHHDLAGAHPPAGDELRDARGQQPRLGLAPARRGRQAARELGRASGRSPQPSCRSAAAPPRGPAGSAEPLSRAGTSGVKGSKRPENTLLTTSRTAGALRKLLVSARLAPA